VCCTAVDASLTCCLTIMLLLPYCLSFVDTVIDAQALSSVLYAFSRGPDLLYGALRSLC
jgi:hypothetical protein